MNTIKKNIQCTFLQLENCFFVIAKKSTKCISFTYEIIDLMMLSQLVYWV